MLGDRNIAWWGLLFSIVATETSTVTFLSIPGFAWSRDFTFIQLPLGYLDRPVPRGGGASCPTTSRGEYFTAYEVLRKRFGGAVGQAASFLFMVTRSLADGLRLFLTAIVVQEMAGPVPARRPSPSSGVTTIVYTFVGGMKAVVWTDVVQFVIYVVGAVVAFVLLLGRLPGGWGELVADGLGGGQVPLARPLDRPRQPLHALGRAHRRDVPDHRLPRRRPADGPALPVRAQPARGRRGRVWMSGVVVFLQFALFLLIGVGLFVFYQAFPPAVAFDRPDRVFVRFIVEQLPHGDGRPRDRGDLRRRDVDALRLAQLLRHRRGHRLLPPARPARRQLAAPAAGDPGLHPRLRPRPDRGWPSAARCSSQTVVESVLTIAGFTTGIILGVFFLGIFTRRVGTAGGVRRPAARPR